MSVTALAWVAIGVMCSIGALARPIWAVCLYYLTFFAAPHLWWWGDQLPTARYSLWAGCLLLGAVAFYRSRAHDGQTASITPVHRLAIAVLINATFVHYLISRTPEVSIGDYIELAKFTLLYFLFESAIRDRNDFRIAMIAIALGAGYIGWEVTINERGEFSGARLEGVGAPAADTSNGLASLMLVALSFTGTLFVGGTIPQRLTVLIAAPLVLNVVILCNSRGAFLGLIASGLSLILLARGATRKKAFQVAILGSVLLYLLLGDPEILERFLTTFAGGEERDNSAASRFTYWSAGLMMLRDYPLGAGGGAFKYVYGPQYLPLVGSDEPSRALHNGYLTDATDWGVQGLALRLLFIGAAMLAAYRTSARCRTAGRDDDTLLGIAIISGTVGFLVCCVFGSYLSNEWMFWSVAFLTRYAVLYAPATVAQQSDAPVVAITAHPAAPRLPLPQAMRTPTRVRGPGAAT